MRGDSFPEEFKSKKTCPFRTFKEKIAREVSVWGFLRQWASSATITSKTKELKSLHSGTLSDKYSSGESDCWDIFRIKSYELKTIWWDSKDRRTFSAREWEEGSYWRRNQGIACRHIFPAGDLCERVNLCWELSPNGGGVLHQLQRRASLTLRRLGNNISQFPFPNVWSIQGEKRESKRQQPAQLDKQLMKVL